MDVSEFYRNAEDIVLGVFNQQGGWASMALALMPDGIWQIAIGEGIEDDDVRAAARLRRVLIENKARAYVVAYATIKAYPETDLNNRRVLGPVMNIAGDRDEMQASPDQMLFLFMSDNFGRGHVHTYSIIGRGKKIGPRQRWLEEADSPFHRLLAHGRN
ncbi:hypothetical protein J5277_29890 [Rhizobium sp. 16-449-1b]|uniref:hypothetical protein n=1 Tax=Rhizobium sp. 16-449-1b TaxID=2819989 RepID=UPI001ADC2CC6|nr:hypothetical protein [Rhizobium sp. 16-449-1b]MBO9198340.1 hypothetical protein [Rhizobium sp. 16-449-1b]